VVNAVIRTKIFPPLNLTPANSTSVLSSAIYT
jgi:hypothetical protein